MTTASQRALARWHAAAMNNDVIEDFSEYQRAARLSPNTVRNRAALLRTFVTTQGVGLLDAQARDLRRHLGRPNVSPGTARTERNALRAFYDFAVAEGLLDENPAERLPTIHVPRPDPRPFTVEQVQAMLHSGAYKRTRAMILVGYFQGFRVSQIARVRGDDLDQVTGTLRTVAKGSKARRVPLHPVVADLARYMPPVSWWFPARDGSDRPVSGASVTNLITRAKKRAGIVDPKLTPHSLRHGFATGLVDQGVDIRTIQELMLHEDISSTQIYTRVSESRKRDAIQLLPGLDIPAQAARRAA